MLNIVLLEDYISTLNEFSQFVKEMGHHPIACQSIDEVLAEVKKDDANIDLFILDHELPDGEKSLELIEIFNSMGYTGYKNRFIVATANNTADVTKDYASFGSMGHLIKPIHQKQFEQSVNHALYRIEYIDEQVHNWESAYELLEETGVIDSIDNITLNNNEINGQYVALKNIHEKLIENLKELRGEDVVKAYEFASQSVENIKGGFDIIYDYTKKFTFTDKFIKDARNAYKTNRIRFFSLLGYLNRISKNPEDYRIKRLHGAGDNMYEYRTGISYRLYFSRHNDGIQLERFGHKNSQTRIINNLSS